MPLDRFFGIAAAELAEKRPDRDLLARAFALAVGDISKTKAIYINLRAESLEQMWKAEVERSRKIEAEEKLSKAKEAESIARQYEIDRARIAELKERFAAYSTKELLKLHATKNWYFPESKSAVTELLYERGALKRE